MARLIPSLQAIRAFDAVARHKSYQGASQELGVTTAALSYQIKKLEEQLNIKLFKRLSRSIELTPAGELMAPKIRRGFSYLDEGLRKLTSRTGNDVLVVSAPPSLTSRWLIPRLHRFFSENADVDIRLLNRCLEREYSDGAVDVEIASRDIAEYGEDIQSFELFVEYMLPVVSPALLEKSSQKSEVGLLERSARILDSAESFLGGVDWSDWFEASEYDQPERERELSTAAPGDAVSAAVAGCGFALVRLSLAMPELMSGALVAPFDVVIQCSRQASCYVGSSAVSCATNTETFVSWLRAEGVAYREMAADYLSGKTVISREEYQADEIIDG